MTVLSPVTKSILLFDGECAVCRRIGAWVKKSAKNRAGESSIEERPIGNDPAELRTLNPSLDIWDAYAVIHLLMPDGTMKEGGEAVAEVLRNLPNCRWFSWSFGVTILGCRPFQWMLNIFYEILSELRPLFGCESCGTPSPWMQPIRKSAKWIQSLFIHPAKGPMRKHSTTRPGSKKPESAKS
jgi:predicted DCC family thiol-disulfide oxidoreductase YuxK